MIYLFQRKIMNYESGESGFIIHNLNLSYPSIAA